MRLDDLKVGEHYAYATYVPRHGFANAAEVIFEGVVEPSYVTGTRRARVTRVSDGHSYTVRGRSILSTWADYVVARDEHRAALAEEQANRAAAQSRAAAIEDAFKAEGIKVRARLKHVTMSVDEAAVILKRLGADYGEEKAA